MPMRTRRSRYLSLVLTTILAAGLSAGCDSEESIPPLTNADLLATGPYGVGYTSLTLVDSTRPTPATAEYGGAPDRTLPTEVWYPASPEDVTPGDTRHEPPAAGEGAPFPLVLFLHGFMGNRFNNALEAQLLASHGYVVAAVDFPLTTMGAPGGAHLPDSEHQPEDVSFVLDELLARNDEAGGLLAGTMDTDRIAVQGHSLGAFTAVLIGMHPTVRDPRIRGVISLAGSACSVPTVTFDEPSVPLLLIHGDLDGLVDYDDCGPPQYAAAQAPKYLVTLLGGTHTGFVDETAELFDGLDHADTIGCAAIDDQLEDPDPDWVAWLLTLGDTPVTVDCVLPCTRPELLEGGMSTLRQVELLNVTVRAFLEGLFHGDTQAQQFLTQDLADQNEDVTVEAAP